MKNTSLIIILIIVVGAYFLFKSVKEPERQKNYESEITQLDTSKVTDIKLLSKSTDYEEMHFSKQDGRWAIFMNDKELKAQQRRVKAMIQEINNIEADRVVTSDKAKWDEYEVSDTIATRVQVFEGDEKKLDLLIGKLSFQQSPGQGFQDQQQPKGTSYIRLKGENEVYAVNAFLPIAFNQELSSFRDNTFLKANKESIKTIEIDFPGDSAYSLVKRDTIWTINGEVADQEKVETYLNLLSSRNLSDFADDFKPSSGPDYQLRISGDNMETIVIDCYDSAGDQYFLHSSLNLSVFFNSKGKGVFSDLLKSKKYFLTAV